MTTRQEAVLHFLPLDLRHLPPVLAIEREAYPDPWTEGMFRQEVSSGMSHFYLGFREDALIAYGGFWLVLDEAHITKVTVAAPWRGQGYGRTMVVHLLRAAVALRAKVARLEVRESNQPARRLYDQLGFVCVGLRKGYYAKTNETAVVMKRDLGDILSIDV